MASFASMLTDIYTVTKRPDLVEETKLALKKATLKMHQLDDFPKDLFETGISWSTPAFIQSLDYKSIAPRFRRFKYLRKYSDSVPGDFFQLLTPEETLDRYMISKDNICYLAGTQIEIRSSTQDSYMLFSCYQSPDVTEASYNSWIADDHPYAIISDAAATIFKMIGFDEQAAYYKQEVVEQIMMLRQANL